MKKALITGITGQDGGYLAEFLLNKGYGVYGMYRRCSVDNHLGRISHLAGKIELVQGDLIDASSLDKVIRRTMPDEIYNLASQSQVRVSFDQPFLTMEINQYGVERLISRILEHVPNSKFYQASTSELFGEVKETPQNEETLFNPLSPYAKTKLAAHEFIQEQRQKGLFACCGILFNHESPRRGLEFVTRKITDGVVRIKLGLPQRETGKNYLELGNLNAKRDWGYAGDYVAAMWLMLQQDKAEDYVIATGDTHTVKEWTEEASKTVGIKQIMWEDEGVNEVGRYNGKIIIRVNPKHFRPTEVHSLLGDASKAKRELGWEPKTNFKELVKMMVESDLNRLKEKKVSSVDKYSNQPTHIP